ncbi:hypothetical protein M422DRAFT_244134 [Sphaerobolus stellatus SS14]|nr:hypothetical protein M422DRAFT_244134 [Sphaerobolus stellatus SS14]
MGSMCSLSAQKKKQAAKSTKKQKTSNNETASVTDSDQTETTSMARAQSTQTVSGRRVRKPSRKVLETLEPVLDPILEAEEEESTSVVIRRSTRSHSVISAQNVDESSYSPTSDSPFDVDKILADEENHTSRRKTSKKPAAPIEEDIILLLTIPSGHSEAAVQTQIPLKEGFTTMIQSIYAAMGCEAYTQKPSLGYKMAGVGQSQIQLKDEKDWDNLLINVKRAAKKDSVVPMQIVPDKKYLESLHHKLGSANNSASGGKKPGYGKAKPGLINLDTIDDDNAEPEDVLDVEKQLEEFTCLKKNLFGCPVHSKPSEYCKINRFSAHILLTVNQIGAWVYALASKTYSVTYDNLPRGELFEDFHTKHPEDDCPASRPPSRMQSISLEKSTGGFATQMATAIAMAQTLVAGFNGIGVPPSHTAPSTKKRKASEAESSGSESDDDGVRYPEVQEFFDDLAKQDPRRNLKEFADKLILKDFYNINELKDKPESFFIDAPFYLTKGNASFVVSKIKATIKRVRKEGRK